MNSANRRSIPYAILAIVLLTIGPLQADEKELPDILKPWQDWVTWDVGHRGCPTPYHSSSEHLCFWPSRLLLSVDEKSASWETTVTVFEPTWVPLPGDPDVWPFDVHEEDVPIVVVERNGAPSVRLSAGDHPLKGKFAWDEMPQRIKVPRQIGILSLTVDGEEIAIPKWDANGFAWLRRVRGEVADKDLLAAQVYRVVEDGIPLWLHSKIELTVSGKSREESLGWVLPQGWQLSAVESPIPVAVDDLGRMKAQVRAGKWTIDVHAFRTEDAAEFQFPPEAEPVVGSELIGFLAKPEFRVAEIQGLPAVDVAQTTFPTAWRNLPIYQWENGTPFQLVEKMRGMGLQRPAGLNIVRHLWLDEDGQSLTYQDQIAGQMQQTWRLDAANGHKLGAVRIGGQGQLITANPQTESPGVEIRSRNLKLDAIGRVRRTRALTATGWQTDAESLRMTLALPPGWRVFALLGADHVDGDWLTAWSLLDLFLLLIFSLAVFRLWGVTAGIIALLAFALAYHEPGAPRLTWLFLLLPLALLRVVPEGAGRRWVKAWQLLAAALLLLFLVPFVASQLQSTIYPQLEYKGMNYSVKRWLGPPLTLAFQGGEDETVVPAQNMEPSESARVAESIQSNGFSDDYSRGKWSGGRRAKLSSLSTSNMMFDLKAKIQTGPATPTWSWNRVRCSWDGPVSADHQIRPILIPPLLHKVLTLFRLALLLALATILFGPLRMGSVFSRNSATVVTLIACTLLPIDSTSAQLPDPGMLKTLRQRMLAPEPGLFPHAADIGSVDLEIDGKQVSMKVEVHAAAEVAVPIPGRMPTWSPITVQMDGKDDALVCRHREFLWVIVPKGVHQLVVKGRLPPASDWEWTFLLKPRRVTVNAPEWKVTGISPSGVPEDQIFFARKLKATDREVAYDRKDFEPIVAVDRHLEIGLIWQVHNEVTRLSAPGKAVSLEVPLLEGEHVLTDRAVVRDGLVEIRLGADETSFAWDSELPIGKDIQLTAANTDRWVERWHLVTSPVWNLTQTGLSPVFEPLEENLIPVWHPWPGETATLTFHKPVAISGATTTIQRVYHTIALGSRQRSSKLKIEAECSLGEDFFIDMAPNAKISSLQLDGRRVPVRRDGGTLVIPLRPGKQSLEVDWTTPDSTGFVVNSGQVSLPVESANISTVMRVPASRWVLWAQGPLRGPAVRFWAIVAFAALAAIVLGSLPQSPIRRTEWLLLVLGLTQVHLVAAMTVVAWFFLLVWRGIRSPNQWGRWRFNLLQLFLVFFTFVMLAILVVVVGEGLLGNPKMFIVGNGSSRGSLQWFQPRASGPLPEPQLISISVWFYRLLMLFWALWLASALIRWLQWAWNQFSHGGSWRTRPQRDDTVDPVSVAKHSESP